MGLGTGLLIALGIFIATIVGTLYVVYLIDSSAGPKF